MLTFILLAYVGFVLVVFKLVKIELSHWSIAAAGLPGVFLMLVLMTAWKFSAPMTDQMTLHRKVIQLNSNQNSKELITKIHAGIDEPVKKGDPLYEVESAPNQYLVDQWTAKVSLAEQQVKEAEAAIELAAAQVEASRADQSLKKAQLDTLDETRKLNPAAVSELRLAVAQQSYESTNAALDQAVASQKAAEFAVVTAKNNLEADRNQLELAELDLSQNVVRAPANGYMINWQTTEGTMTTTVITSPQGTFMDTESEVVGAIFPQNQLKNVAAGNAVEIAFRSRPGEVVAGKVKNILDYTGEGQLVAGALVPSVKSLNAKGYLLVQIELDDKELAASLPLGAAGSVAIYTDKLKPFQIISRISIRMKMWMNYMPF